MTISEGIVIVILLVFMIGGLIDAIFHDPYGGI